MRIQKRGNIIDIVWGFRPATVFCLKHFKYWKEGASFPPFGKACYWCVTKLDKKYLLKGGDRL